MRWLVRALTIARRVVLDCSYALTLVSMVVIGGMMLTIAYDVVVRFVFAAPTDWAYPLNAFGVLSGTLLVVPYLYAKRQHIAMDLVHRSLPRSLRTVSNVVTALAAGVFGVMLAVMAWRSMLVAIEGGLTGSGTFNIPLWIHDAVLLLTGVMLVLVAALFPPTESTGPVAEQEKDGELA